MRIFVFGNEDLEMDSLPVKLLPELQEKFPEHEFLLLDPNEEWPLDEPFLVIDTVVGLEEPKVFDSLDAFQDAPRMSVHDFDAFGNMRLLQKLGKLPEIKIVGLPPTISRESALEFISSQI